MLTVFYDGQCPLCSKEMLSLKKHDKHNQIKIVDIHEDEFSTTYPDVDFHKAMRILHGTYQGKLLLGLEVTHRAWTLVGKGFWVAPLNWPVIKTVSHWIYLGVAKYRLQISAFVAKLTGIKTPQCEKGTCYGKSTNINHRR